MKENSETFLDNNMDRHVNTSIHGYAFLLYREGYYASFSLQIHVVEFLSSEIVTLILGINQTTLPSFSIAVF